MIALRSFVLTVLTILLFAAVFLSWLFDHPVHAILAIALYFAFGLYMAFTIPRPHPEHGTQAGLTSEFPIDQLQLAPRPSVWPRC